MNRAFKIAVIESEAGWGRKVDDYMICLTEKDTLSFQKEFNSKNTEKSTPAWYMAAEGDVESHDLTDAQYNVLLENKRVWLSELKKI